MKVDEVSALIASIYDSALNDDAGWGHLSRALSSAFGCESCLLQMIDLGVGCASVLGATPNFDAAATSGYEAYYHAKDLWVERAPKNGTPQALVGQQLVSDRELLRTEFYGDFCKRIGIFHLLGAVLPIEGSVVTTVGIQRAFGSDAFEKNDKDLLQLLMPHLRSAVQIHRRIDVFGHVSRMAWDALDALSIGLMVVSQRAKLLFTNAAADRFLQAGQGIAVRNGFLHSKSQRHDTMLKRAIGDAALASTGRSSKASAFLVVPQLTNRPLALLICPLPPDRMGLKSPTRGAAIFVGQSDDRPVPPHEILAKHYKLTPAEARLAVALVSGVRLQDYAEQNGIALHTARNHLKRIFVKTDHHRQSELVRDVLTNPILRMALLSPASN
jgi:DNA-binding CsgD family transcriptional regulator